MSGIGVAASGRCFDAIVIGGGIAGSSLAAVLARAGLDVALLERTGEFEDRVRGEALAPWGVAEARRLGLIETLLETANARWLPTWSTYSGGALRSVRLPEVDPHNEPILSFRHQEAQRALWELARRCGVATCRPAQPEGLPVQRRGMVTIRVGGRLLQTRLLVGADGRASSIRGVLGRRYLADSPTHTVSGLLVRGTHVDPNAVLTGRVRHGRLLLFPIDETHTRVYYMAGLSQARTLRGRGASEEILAVCRKELPPRWFSGATPAGPSATFPNSDRWVPHPWSGAVVLVGDAAGISDPSIGQGLSVALRDVRELKDRLLGKAVFAEACARYACERLRYFHTQRMIARWTWEMDEPGSKGRSTAAPGIGGAGQRGSGGADARDPPRSRTGVAGFGSAAPGPFRRSRSAELGARVAADAAGR